MWWFSVPVAPFLACDVGVLLLSDTEILELLFHMCLPCCLGLFLPLAVLVHWRGLGPLPGTSAVVLAGLRLFDLALGLVGMTQLLHVASLRNLALPADACSSL